MPITSRVRYPISLDVKSTKKSNSIVSTQLGESLLLDLTITDNEYTTLKNLDNMYIDLICVLNKNDGSTAVYKQDYDTMEDGESLINIISDGRVELKLRRDFAIFEAVGLAEVHIRDNEGNRVITNRFSIRISNSYTNVIPDDWIDNSITIEKLEDMLINYNNILKDLEDMKNGNTLNHVHLNLSVLNKITEVNGQLLYDGNQIKVEISGEIEKSIEEYLLSYYDKTQIDNFLNKKVDKVDGKNLSTNDYTDAEKNKLATLSNYNDTTIKTMILNIDAKKAETVHEHNTYAVKQDVYVKSEVDGFLKYTYPDDPSILNIKDALDKLLYTPLIINISSDKILLQEKGVVHKGVTLSWNYNKSIVSQNLNNVSIENTIRSYTYPYNISSDMTFTLATRDSKSLFNKSINFEFVYPVYIGALPSNISSPDHTQIGSLNKRILKPSSMEFDFTIDNMRMAIVAPKSWIIKSIIDANGFDITSSFKQNTLVMLCLDGTLQEYKAYVSEPTTQTNFIVKFNI